MFPALLKNMIYQLPTLHKEFSARNVSEELRLNQAVI